MSVGAAGLERFEVLAQCERALAGRDALVVSELFAPFTVPGA